MFVIILSLVFFIICILSYLLQNYYLSASFQTMKSLPGPVRLPFIGASFLLQKPKGNNNNNNNNNVIIRLIYKDLGINIFF